MQIDLEPHEFRPAGLRHDPKVSRALLRSAAIAGVWFTAAVIFGRYAEHGQPWYVIAAAALAPFALLFYITVELDD
jgi:hypothetical protein